MEYRLGLSPRYLNRSPRMADDGSAARIPITGAVTPKRFSAVTKGFSRFEYISDPYDGDRQGMASGVTDRPVFKCSAMETAPKQSGTFQRFRYAVDPYERFEQQQKGMLIERDAKLVGERRFVAGGNARDPKTLLRRRVPELRMQLHQLLRNDWANFWKIAEDSLGMIMVLFSADRLTLERRKNLHEYMNRLVVRNSTIIEFGLTRDAMRWNVTQQSENGGPLILSYVFRPPWVPPLDPLASNPSNHSRDGGVSHTSDARVAPMHEESQQQHLSPMGSQQMSSSQPGLNRQGPFLGKTAANVRSGLSGRPVKEYHAERVPFMR